MKPPIHEVVDRMRRELASLKPHSRRLVERQRDLKLTVVKLLRKELREGKHASRNH